MRLGHVFVTSLNEVAINTDAIQWTKSAHA